MEDFNDGLDGNIAARMRKVNAEQFHTLVKMHLSFELDLNTEENDTVAETAKNKKWGILHFSKKQKPEKKTEVTPKGVEGAASLTKEGINQVKQLIEYLSKKESIEQEGIFRRTGKLTRQQELKTALYKGLPLNLDEGRFSVHDCASVLKGFLADLPEPLLTDLHYPAHCQIAELCNPDKNANEIRLLTSLQLLLLLLPSPNRIVLKHIIKLLNETAANENSNKMNCDTLATLFTPHLMCPRKLTPEALHVNSQNLSGLVSFMIKKGTALFEIPPKLSTDIRAFWVEQEKKLLSPEYKNLNESTADITGTAHTVFSFVDRNLTAQATASQDTQAALAQLYAHIQSMPESSKKRRLVKQFNKENGQGTPRHVKTHNSGGKSFGDSIKKRIFQKKLLSHKKIIDVNLGCNYSRSSSEENIISNTRENSTILPKSYSKSEDELSDLDNYESHENLVKSKPMSHSMGSINKNACIQKENSENIISKRCGSKESLSKLKQSPRYSRHRSEPPNMYSTQNNVKNDELMRQHSDPALPIFATSDTVETESPLKEDHLRERLDSKSSSDHAPFLLSPVTKSKLRMLYAAHTSTPSNLLRKSLAMNDYVLTPITDDDKSMSPITQSATKMPRAMQETMMTPRSRKPVIMASASNLCGLGTLNNGSIQYDSATSLQTSNFDLVKNNNYPSIAEESNLSSTLENKENIQKVQGSSPDDQSYVTCLEDDYNTVLQQKVATSNVNTFKEYFLSRSVLTASPVDLSFTSRTGDFEQSESDLNVLVEESNNPGSDTSGVISGSTNSMNNSGEKIEESIPSPRKRCTSLQRNDSKRSIKDESICEKFKCNKTLKQKQLSESTLSSLQIKESLPETSF